MQTNIREFDFNHMIVLEYHNEVIYAFHYVIAITSGAKRQAGQTSKLNLVLRFGGSGPYILRVFPAQLGLEALALAQLVGALAFKNPKLSQGQHSRLGPASGPGFEKAGLSLSLMALSWAVEFWMSRS